MAGIAKCVVGEKVKIIVEGKGQKGDWFGHYQSMVVFVKGESPIPLAENEEVTVEISAITVNCAFGRVVE